MLRWIQLAFASHFVLGVGDFLGMADLRTLDTVQEITDFSLNLR